MPRLVAGLSRQVIVAVSAAKHHTAAVSAEGELYTWGANRHGQLGYTVDTQPTPRKCMPVHTHFPVSSDCPHAQALCAIAFGRLAIARQPTSNHEQQPELGCEQQP